MKHLLVALLLSSVSICSSSLAFAAPVIDQNQASAATQMAGFWQSNLAQSFIQTNSNISGAGIFLDSAYGTTGTVTITLWDALPNQADAHQLASATGNGTAGSWLDVYWNPANITPGTTYFLGFTSQSGMGISGDTSNPYADGQVFADTESYQDFDYTFRTYFDDGLPNDNQQAPVPEPSTFLLLGAGLAGIGLIRKRARK